MNAAAKGEDEGMAVKKGNGENARHPTDVAGPVEAPSTQPLTGNDGTSATVTAPGIASTASTDDSATSSQTTTGPADTVDTVSDEIPRKRRGILLGTRPGQAAPAAVDDEKSLSWMATQAVKAANAVKASQLEQAQAWKNGAGMPEDDIAAPDAVESVDMPVQQSAQPSSGEMPDATEVMPPVEPAQEATTTPPIPPGARATAPRVPARMALMLGVLVMFGYAGYRHWFSGDHTAGNTTATTSDLIESAGPAEEVNMMRPPAISVVAAPEPAVEQSTPPAVEAEIAPMTGPAADVQPTTARPLGEPAVPAVGAQEAAAVSTPQSVPANPASAVMPEPWQPAAAPAAPAPATEAGVAAAQPAPPSSLSPTAGNNAVASQPQPPSPSPAVEARVPASQPVAPAPAARPRYPANGYGYYQPPSSWQPYYQPGYQQAPARR